MKSTSHDLSYTLLALLLAACGASVSGVDPRSQDAVARDAALPEQPTPTCASGTWCWQHPLPQGNAITTVYTVSAREAWAAGAAGTLLHFVDGVWTPVRSPVDYDFRSLWGSGPDDVWALATLPEASSLRYAVLRWNGAQWTRVSFGEDPTVIAMSGGGEAGNVWLVTMTGFDPRRPTVFTIRRWDGAAFVTVAALPDGERPTSLCVRSRSEVWALAASSSATDARALFRWNGAAWSRVFTSTQRSDNLATSFACPADGVALAIAGGIDTPAPQRLLTVDRTGATLGPLPLQRTGYLGLARSPHGEAHLVNTVEAMQWTSAGWRTRFSTREFAPNVSQFDITTDGSAGWLANYSAIPSMWNGAAWVHPSRLAGSRIVRITDAEGASPTTALGAGSLAVRAGDRWTFTELPVIAGDTPMQVTDVWPIDARDAWVVGARGAIARWSADRTLVAAPVAAPGRAGSFDTNGLLSVDGADANTVWAVGEGGTMLQLRDGQWGPPSVLPPSSILGQRREAFSFDEIDVASATDVLVAGHYEIPDGGGSALLSFDGATWTVEPFAAGPRVRIARASDHARYLSDGGRALFVRRRGERTQTMVATFDGTIVDLRVRASGAIDVLAATLRDAALYERAADGGEFVQVGPRIPTANVRAAHRGAGGERWVVGEGGAVLRYAP